jgi:DNA repair exonuclease SbcCD ATPase subunit
MLKTLRIKNFQKFGSIRLEFSPTLTTIIGSSDSGKSSLFRALQWVVLNRPTGVGFVKHGTNDTRVRLTTDHHRIERSRIASDNAYFLDGKKYKSFSTSVPEDLQKASGMTLLNFQSQHDPLFWFSLSPSALSAEINRLVDLESIDYVNKKLRAKEKTASLEIEKKQEVLALNAKELRALEGIEELDEELTIIETLVRHDEQISRLLSRLEQNADLFDDLVQNTAVLKEAASELEEVARLEYELESVDRSFKDLTRLDAEISECVDNLKTIKHDYSEAMKTNKECPTCGRPL